MDEHTKYSYQRFFKEEVCWYGVKSASVGKIARKYFDEIVHQKKQKIWSLCEQLLASDYCEEVFIAFDWVYRLHERYEPVDFDFFERWIGLYVNNWRNATHSATMPLEHFLNNILGLFGDSQSGQGRATRGFVVQLPYL